MALLMLSLPTVKPKQCLRFFSPSEVEKLTQWLVLFFIINRVPGIGHILKIILTYLSAPDKKG